MSVIDIAGKMAEVGRLVDTTTDDEAFAAGFDCGKNGVTFENSHFRFFTLARLTRAWERGKAMAEREKA